MAAEMRSSKIAVGMGCVLLVISAALYIVLQREAAAEQALSPGEESLGVAVIGMMYGLPMLATAVAGVLSVGLGICLWAFARRR